MRLYFGVFWCVYLGLSNVFSFNVFSRVSSHPVRYRCLTSFFLTEKQSKKNLSRGWFESKFFFACFFRVSCFFFWLDFFPILFFWWCWWVEWTTTKQNNKIENQESEKKSRKNLTLNVFWIDDLFVRCLHINPFSESAEYNFKAKNKRLEKKRPKKSPITHHHDPMYPFPFIYDDLTFFSDFSSSLLGY